MTGWFRHSLLAVGFLAMLSRSAILPTQDTISATLMGAGEIDYQRPSGALATMDDILYAGFAHRFLENLSARITVRLSDPQEEPSLFEGLISWGHRGLALDAGFLSEQYGAVFLHNPHSLFNPLVDKPLLWDTHGAGLRLSVSAGPAGLGASVTLNSRESGAALARYYQSLGPLTWQLIGGFESYSEENQDNGVVGGVELTGKWKMFAVHPEFKYTYYTGFDHQRNPSMVPGYLTEWMCELALYPTSRFSVTDLVWGTREEKRFSHDHFWNSSDVNWQVWGWVSAGIGCDVSRDDSFTSAAPGVYVAIIPVVDKAEIRIDGSRTISGPSSPVYAVKGSLWISL